MRTERESCPEPTTMTDARMSDKELFELNAKAAYVYLRLWLMQREKLRRRPAPGLPHRVGSKWVRSPLARP